MGKIFVRERTHVGEGTGRPRFAIFATQGTDVQFYAEPSERGRAPASAEETECGTHTQPAPSKIPLP